MSQTEELTVMVSLSLLRYKLVVQSCTVPGNTRRVTITIAERLCSELEQWLKKATPLLAKVIDSKNLGASIDRSDELRRAYKFAKTLMPQIVMLREGIRDYRAGRTKLLTTVMNELKMARSSSG